jgi:hypothetical protein
MSTKDIYYWYCYGTIMEELQSLLSIHSIVGAKATLVDVAVAAVSVRLAAGAVETL